MSDLVKKECKYPNGSSYVELWVHNRCIGSAIDVPGGWLVTGRRKPVPTLREAAKQCLDKRISELHNEIGKCRVMLATVLRSE